MLAPLRLLLLLCVVVNIRLTEADGKFYIQMIKYVNHDSYSSDGLYCDTVLNILWLNACDPIFTLLVDAKVDGGHGLFHYGTNSHENMDVVNFNSRFGAIGNPVVVAINYAYPGYVKFGMDVTDHDVDAHDHIDTFRAHLIALSTSGRQSLTLEHKGHTLSIQYWFQCDQYYYGPNCNKHCRPHNDDTNGHYRCDENGNKVCLEGWVQADSGCKVLHPCRANACKNGGTCVKEGEGHRCLCAADYGGANCEQYLDPCVHRNPCLNGAACFLDEGRQPDCRCSPQFRGPFCQYDVNECEASPCSNNQTCVNTFGGFVCNCTRYFAGRLCELDVNECNATDASCENGGRCVNVHGNFSCICATGWTGRSCDVDVDECMRKPCRNGGVCANTNGSFVCNCTREYTGRVCELHKCKDAVCHNGGNCSVSAHGAAGCVCAPGFNGTSCEENVDDCSSSPCRNGAECVDGVADFECRCRPGFRGRRCEENVDDCRPNPCKNGGACTDGVQDFACDCARGFEGERCERRVDVDDCFGVVCDNNGTCEDLKFDWRCNCPAAFAGRRCELAAEPPTPAPVVGDGTSSASVAVGVSLAILLVVLVVAAVVGFVLLRRRRDDATWLWRSRRSTDDSQPSAFDNPVYEEIRKPQQQQQQSSSWQPAGDEEARQQQQQQQQQSEEGAFHNPVYDNDEMEASAAARRPPIDDAASGCAYDVLAEDAGAEQMQPQPVAQTPPTSIDRTQTAAVCDHYSHISTLDD